MKKPAVMTILLTVLAMLLSLGVATAADKTVNVKFPKGSNGTTIDASIRGSDAIKYLVDVSAGQQMSIQLDTNNTSNYFNVTAPGASAALFNGSIKGNSTTLKIPSSGKYEIDVYLMRNAARRGERANFELTIYVEGKASVVPSQPAKPTPAAPAAVDTSSMPRFCAGEASAKFNVRPQDITTNMAFKSGNWYVAQGWFDAPGGTKFFNCWFSLDDGSFQFMN